MREFRCLQAHQEEREPETSGTASSRNQGRSALLSLLSLWEARWKSWGRWCDLHKSQRAKLFNFYFTSVFQIWSRDLKLEMVAHPKKREQRPFLNFSLTSCSGSKGVTTGKLSTHEGSGSRKRWKGSRKRVNHRQVSLYRFKHNSTLGFQVHRLENHGGRREQQWLIVFPVSCQLS